MAPLATPVTIIISRLIRCYASSVDTHMDQTAAISFRENVLNAKTARQEYEAPTCPPRLAVAGESRLLIGVVKRLMHTGFFCICDTVRLWT